MNVHCFVKRNGEILPTCFFIGFMAALVKNTKSNLEVQNVGKLLKRTLEQRKVLDYYTLLQSCLFSSVNFSGSRYIEF